EDVRPFSTTIMSSLSFFAPTQNPQTPLSSRPLQNPLFRPISVSGENFNPHNTQCIPAVKIFSFLELEQNLTFFKGLSSLNLKEIKHLAESRLRKYGCAEGKLRHLEDF
ncbi:MAG: hypothetical protein Q8P24_15515, partial [Desulfobacterales bacterium]|nr:hypothetical protein [Desulfobacterales bacterium]